MIVASIPIASHPLHWYLDHWSRALVDWYAACHRSLCLYLHRATDGFIISDTINCFELPDGFPASVGNSTCLPEQYAPSHRQLSSTVIILIVVVPLCFALVVVVVAIASWAHYRKRTNYLMIDETTPIRKASSMSSDRS